VREALEKESELVVSCFRYLSTLPYTMWADWFIAAPDRRLLAARWLAQQVEGVATIGVAVPTSV
jgi:hypothetical protein